MGKQKALLLLSGGIDSPVAGFVAKEKFELLAIHFSQEPFTDSTPQEKALAAAKKLGIKELIVVDAGKLLQNIADNTYREYYFVLMKIFFMKAAEKIAQEKKCEFLVTGESLGQVSSQTLSNLNNINREVRIEILRPLLFLEKQEIIDISTKEGFFEASCGKEMCDALATGKPKTISDRNKISQEEIRCGMEMLATEAVKNMKTLKVN